MKNKCHESVVIKKSVREHEKIIKRKFPPPFFILRKRKRPKKFQKLCMSFVLSCN